MYGSVRAIGLCSGRVQGPAQRCSLRTTLRVGPDTMVWGGWWDDTDYWIYLAMSKVSYNFVGISAFIFYKSYLYDRL